MNECPRCYAKELMKIYWVTLSSGEDACVCGYCAVELVEQKEAEIDFAVVWT